MISLAAHFPLYIETWQVNLAGNSFGLEGAKPLADALRANTSLASCNVLGNDMDIATAKLLVEAVKEKNISLCGIQPDQTSAGFRYKNLKPPDAVLLASDLSKAGLSGALTHLDLGGNSMGSEGAKALAAALKMSDMCTLKKLNADSSSFNHPDLVAACSQSLNDKS